MKSRVITRASVVTIRLLTVVAMLAAMGAAASVPSATAATSSYWATFPPGECAGRNITVFPPYSVSPWANDTKIAWRAHIYRYEDRVGWVDQKVPTSWMWADVVGGQVYAPYGQSGGWTINSAGQYAVSVQVYSYGLRDYFDYRLALWQNSRQVTSCGF